jgi:hypothetical protein
VARRSDGRPALSRRSRRRSALWGAAALFALAARVTVAAAEDGFDALVGQLLGLEAMTAPKLQDVVGQAGGVPFTTEVPVEFLTHDGLREYLKEAVAAEYPPSEAQADARTLAAFDLLPSRADLQKMRLELLEQNIAGFYDERPTRRRLYVVSEDRTLTPINQLILAHELRHALQDQHVSVHTLLPASIGDFDDRRLALLAILEGDATLVMERFLAQRLEAAGRSIPDLSEFTLPTSPMPGTPEILRDQMVLPYAIGTPFARELWKRGGWAAVKEAWARPPESTEQVLHPEKYWSDERPLEAPIASAPSKGQLLREGVLGESYARTLLGEGSEAAAAGWGGDSYKVWDVSGKTLMVWRAVWDTEADAREFHDALAARHARTHKKRRSRAEWTMLQKGSWNTATRRVGSDTWLVSTDAAAPMLHQTLANLTTRKGDH